MTVYQYISHYSAVLCVIYLCATAVFSCDPMQPPPPSVYPEGPIIGENGPEAMRGWDVDTLYGSFGLGFYHNTGGDWYITIENKALLNAEFTQLFIIREKNDTDTQNWVFLEGYRISGKFLYLDDPLKAYATWDYILFIYVDYKGPVS